MFFILGREIPAKSEGRSTNRSASTQSKLSLKFRLVISCGFIPPEAKTFLKCTRDQVEHPKVIVTATSFTFGREDLLPHIFKQLIQQPLLKEILQNRILTKKNHTNDRSHF